MLKLHRDTEHGPTRTVNKLEKGGTWGTTFFSYIGFNMLRATRGLGTGLFLFTEGSVIYSHFRIVRMYVQVPFYVS